jgi:ABC-type transport system involved in cytochrome bd biosynthesis fused ATPase/permease subunit
MEKKKAAELFNRENYMWMGIGIAIVLIGLALMSGGKSADPNIFNNNEVYSFRRVTLAPILIVLGLMVEVYAIMKRPKA